MAGEWIRVRAALRKDPRVRAMADFLAEQRAFMDWMTDPVRRTCGVTVYEHVTRDVTVRITVCALVDLWSAANEAGKGDGDDLVMVHCTIDALDTMADLPCFGEAMASVDWAIQEEDERGRPVVRLPKFLIHNTPADERKPSAAAERQRRYRQRQAEQAQERDVTRDASSNVTRDVTVTPREEKRREEEKEPPNPQGGGEGFDLFWTAWPSSDRKAAKAQCLTKWKAKGCAAIAGQIVSHVEAMKRSAKWQESAGQFIPAPLVYLNQARWEAPVAEAASFTVSSSAAEQTRAMLDAYEMTPEEEAAAAEARRRAVGALKNIRREVA